MDKDTSSLPPLPVWAKYVTKESLPVDLYIIADIIGLDNTIRIMEHFNYLTFNIPKNVSYPYKKQYILDNYDGTKESRFHIRKAYNVSDSYMYWVKKKKKKRRRNNEK